MSINLPINYNGFILKNRSISNINPSMDLKQIKKNNGLKAVLFDMDGVLVDSMNYHLKSWKQLLENFNITVTDEFIYDHEGAMAPEIIMDLFKEYGYLIEDKQIKEIYLEQNTLFQEQYLPRVGLYPQALPLLEQLKSRGLLLGLVTSSRRNLVQEIWEENDLRFFDTIVTADETERFKPYPDPYLKAMNALGQETQNCLVIENAPAGIQAACSAGITCFAISSTLPKEKLSQAQKVFPDLNALTVFFKAIF